VEQVRPIADFLRRGWLAGRWDAVIFFSAHFRSALKQEPLARQILPVDFSSLQSSIGEIVPETGKFAEAMKEAGVEFGQSAAAPREYLIEPSAGKVLTRLSEHLFLMQIYHLILEANASEHAARRMAMKTASDNAIQLGAALNLAYNKSRQAAITNEIIEITSGAGSL
jgi:F-type H+-transporting ATPase subunit gamma